MCVWCRCVSVYIHMLQLYPDERCQSIEINSSKVRKVANYCGSDKDVVPYISFCTPTSRVQVQQYNFVCL